MFSVSDDKKRIENESYLQPKKRYKINFFLKCALKSPSGGLIRH